MTEFFSMVGHIAAAGGALFAYLSRRHAKRASETAARVDDAVNHAHVRGEPRLYDRVRSLEAQVERLRDDIAAHVEWEETQKWPGIEAD